MPATTTPATGDIVGWGGTDPFDSNWLACDGASYTTAGQAALFAVIGYTYGGAGANFNVPELRQRIPRGSTTVASSGGTIDHTHTQSGHTHPVTIPDHGQHVAAGSHSHNAHTRPDRTGGGANDDLGGPASHSAGGDHQHAAHTSHANAAAAIVTPGASSTANPPFQAINYVIHV